MQIVTSQAELTLEGAAITLRGVKLIINGAAVEPQAYTFTDRSLTFVLPNNVQFGIEWESGELLALRYWLQGYSSPLDSFGLRFERVENLRAFLRNGYHSWDGSFYVEPSGIIDAAPDSPRLDMGYGMIQLLPRTGSSNLVIGFDRHDRFQHTFTVGKEAAPSLTIQTLWDRKRRKGRCESERLLFIEDTNTENGLRQWAQAVAAASPTPPRLHKTPIIGWCSWYDQYNTITEASLLEVLHPLKDLVQREKLPMQVFQIDDGFTPEMGDWLDVKGVFPRGIKPLLDDIRTAGFVPGLWIAPFIVGNRSQLYHDHPDWVLHDTTGQPIVQMKLYGEFRWGKRSEAYYILDATHPEAFAYIREVFRTWRHEWGCEYFKIDFYFWGAEYGPDRAVYHAPGQTRIEVWRRFSEMIREEIGDAAWLACGAPIWAGVGLVDGVRIGRDVGARWGGTQSAESLLRDQASRNFANHILWQGDPDCVLLRERYHELTDGEVQALAIYAGMTGGVLTTSDALHRLPAERLRLWKLLLNPARHTCRYPLLGQTPLFYERRGDPYNWRQIIRAHDPVLVQVRYGEGGVGALFVFNPGDQPVERTYFLEALGIPAPAHLFEWTRQNILPEAVSRLSVTLQPHEGRLFFFGESPFERVPEVLP